MPFLTLGADMARPSKRGGKTSGAKARNASPAKDGETTETKRRIAPLATGVKHRSGSGQGKDLKQAREQSAMAKTLISGPRP